MTAESADRFLGFDDYVLDTVTPYLYRHRRPVPLSGAARRVLTALVRRAGETVSHDDLLDAGWGPGQASPRALTDVVSQIRKQLGGNGKYVRNQKGHGYCFDAAVTPVDRLIPSPRVSATSIGKLLRDVGSRPIMAVAWLLTLAAGVVVGHYMWRDRTSVEPHGDRGLHAVIPLGMGFLPLPADLALAPDAAAIAYVARPSDSAAHLRLRRMDRFDSYRINVATDVPRAPFFSPNGTEVGFFDAGELMRVAVAGGTATRVASVGRHPLVTASWGAGGQIAFADGADHGLWIVDAGGGSPRRLTAPDPSRGEYRHLFPSFLPDGRHVVFMIERAGISSLAGSQIAVVSTEGGAHRVLLEHGGTGPTYSPSGYLTFASGNRLLAVQFDLARLRASGSPQIVVDNLRVRDRGLAVAVVANSGALAYWAAPTSASTSSIHWVDPNGHSERVDAAAGRHYESYRNSPDGRHLVAAIDGKIQLFDHFNNRWSELATGSAHARSPLWGPEGETIIYSSNPDGHFDLYEAATDGRVPPRLILSSALDKQPTDWSEVGQRLLVEIEHPARGADIYLLDLTTSAAPQPLFATDKNERAARFVGGGAWVVYSSEAKGRSEIHVRRIDGYGPGERLAAGGGANPIWSSETRRLVFRRGADLLSMYMRFEPSFVARAVWKHGDEPTPGFYFDLAADGSRTLVRRLDDESETTSVRFISRWP